MAPRSTGGRFSLAGTLIGALIIQTLTSMIYSMGVPPEVNMVVKAVLVFAVMLLQSAEFRGVMRGLALVPGARQSNGLRPRMAALARTRRVATGEWRVAVARSQCQRQWGRGAGAPSCLRGPAARLPASILASCRWR